MQDVFCANRAIHPDVCPIAPAEDRWHSVECPWRGTPFVFFVFGTQTVTSLAWQLQVSPAGGTPFRTAVQDVYK